jgi:hypothetical protein
VSRGEEAYEPEVGVEPEYTAPPPTITPSTAPATTTAASTSAASTKPRCGPVDPRQAPLEQLCGWERRHLSQRIQC